ncbi:MAG: glycosyltransferase family 39 protein [bacterium]
MLNLFSQNYLTRGFWGDEAWTAGISRLPIQEIIKITSQDFHPPLYYFFVHALGNLVGFHEVPIRLISVFFFLLTPIVTYILIRKFWDTKKRTSHQVALVTSLLVATAPILFTYAFEARSYALLALESVLSAYVFWRARLEQKGSYTFRIFYFILGGLMVYTHYYAWFVLASHAFYLLLFERKRILPMLPAALGVLAVQLPWLPTLFAQTNSVKGSYWIGPINYRTHYEFFLRVTGGDVTTQWQFWLAAIIGTIILLDLFIKLVQKKVTREHRFLLTWLFIPTLLPTLVSFVLMPVFFYRYLIFSAIPLLILTVQALKDLPKILFFIPVILIAYLQLRVDRTIFAQYPRSMREVTQELYQTKLQHTEPVYTVLPAFAEVMYYTADHDQIIVSPEGLIQFSGKSLLDAYVRLGLTTIEEPPKDKPYYFLTPEKEIKLITPTQ